jgi:hypothetical protein
MTLRGPVVKRRIAAKATDVANSKQELCRNCVRGRGRPATNEQFFTEYATIIG